MLDDTIRRTYDKIMLKNLTKNSNKFFYISYSVFGLFSSFVSFSFFIWFFIESSWNIVLKYELRFFKIALWTCMGCPSTCIMRSLDDYIQKG